MFLRSLTTTSVFAIVTATAALGCEIDARVSVVGNEFPAIQTVGAGAQECTGAEVSTNLTSEHQSINLPGMQGTPAEYTTAIIANSSIVALMNEDVIRPLGDLVAAHGEGLNSNQLITIGGEVMAVAFMANAQHLVYRADILEQIGVEPPSTYEEMLAAAEMIRDQGIMENPVGGAYASGWNLAQEFNNMFLGYGGTHFEPGTAVPNVNSEAGLAALEMMRSLSDYMNLDFLTHDSNATNAEFRAGNVALMNMWGSRAATMLDVDGLPQGVIDGFAIAGPMTVGGGDIPASTLWWDGWTVASNISDAEAEATFIAMMNGIRPDILEDETVAAQAVWLIPGYEPTDAAVGVFAAAEAGTIPYPMLPYMGLLHTALGNELADFMQGNESAEQALADVEAAYTAAAREQGFLQ
ncbi:extracellular solute-binding protein [Roseobacter sp. HKCCD9010]|uniref:ABC transporter substrate-binding protein n=1 Tax=unclassified Roseobacter TaxID=196798 RepID=UPI00149124F9|nr:MULTISPECIES: extracellular solute-binding protein [unclassified Roseobacter]MBF9051792.1 extracellular solute-binding protein [Rhodobacterales bacterium HKCCD4356]NNV13785.1 extracellular solute-binding protein [Roseobacter sp. HKCCD7357]NNV17810.1 extracellular solute-binding protein [Roseobacter sp. HKCCD8768]NNV27417.1 extracellular solute-binding protein [Roseobacter sp. HKCCD8192]NNV31537.1 extracellular solute-binding protein [Roseobacter sp. HKCCD9061]